MTEAELELLLDRAAKRGAQEALRSIGLHDDDAVHDVKDLRDLLTLWREAQRAVTTTITKAITVGILSLLAVGAYVKWGGQ
jgi:hypothetical protein